MISLLLLTATVLRLPYYTYNYLLSSNSPTGPSPLAQNSLLLLLVLVHYRKCLLVDETIHEKLDAKGEDATAVLADADQLVLNPFCQALDSARDTECKTLLAITFIIDNGLLPTELDILLM